MVLPSVTLYELYSLQLYETLNIVFDLTVLDIEQINETIIDMIPTIFSINTIEKKITIKGYPLNDSTFIVNSYGNTIYIPYTCSNEDIITGIQYVYQIYKNKVTKCENNVNTEWNPKPYCPED